MGLRLGTSIAHAPETNDDALQMHQTGQAPKEKSNSRNKTFPKLPTGQGSTKKAAARAAVENNAEEQERDEDPKKLIERLAFLRYTQSASIDAAIALAYENKDRPLTGAELEAKRRIGFSDEMWEEIMIRVAEGESVIKICRDSHMPSRTAVYRWMREKPELDRQYQNAMLLKADKSAEQANDLAIHMQRRAEMGASSEEITALRTAITTLQWTASRLNQRKYGDRQAIDLDAKVQQLPESQVDARIAALMTKVYGKQVEPAPPTDE